MDFRHSSENKFQKQLSSKEMLLINKEISLLFSPYISKNVSSSNNALEMAPQELLEVSQNISLYYSPKISSQSKKLVILPIDPQHVFVYWDLADTQDANLSQKLINNEIKLRVYSQSNGIDKEEPVIEIPIHAVQAQERIALPLVNNKAVFSAIVGKSTEEIDFVPFLTAETTYTIQANSHQNILDEVAAYELSTSIDCTVPEKLQYLQTNHSAKGKKRSS